METRVSYCYVLAWIQLGFSILALYIASSKSKVIRTWTINCTGDIQSFFVGTKRPCHSKRDDDYLF